MTIGTLRDQVIYPDTYDDMKKKKHSEKDLTGLLEKVQLQYLIERENGWDSIQDWYIEKYKIIKMKNLFIQIIF